MFYAANMEIHRYRNVHNLSETPRITVVACLIQHNIAFWAYCDDSRLYWMYDGQILAHTRDHSRIESLIAQDKADPSERATHPDRNKLFNCLGATNMPIVELSRRVNLQVGDVMPLCSEGLWSMLPDHVLAKQLLGSTIVGAVPVSTALGIVGKSSDNVTARVMARGNDPNMDDSSPSIFTHALSMDSLTTTIQVPRLGAIDAADCFTDADIERGIAGIRGAI